MTEPVRLRVRSHGTYQIEFKIDYELSSARETRYTVNTYIFVPNSLGINSRTYFNYDFHRDIQNYVRLRTPLFSLDDLATVPGSPLVIAERILDTDGWYRSDQGHERLITNLRLVRPVLNASLRAHLRRALRRQRHPDKSIDLAVELQIALDQMVELGRGFVDRFRLLEDRLVDQDDAGHTHDVFELVDEAVSVVFEDALMWAYRIADKQFENANACLERLRQEIVKEVEHRKRRKYRSILRQDSTNEEYLQTTSFLKKYTTGALYLSTATEREGTTLEQLLFAIAAGLSMVFATVVAFYSQARYGVLTFPVFVALVVGYMFKDRIKELGRDLSEKMIRTIRYDQRTTLYAPDGKNRMGYLREKMAFIDHAGLPEIICGERKQHDSGASGLEDQDEKIICYAKEVTIKRSAFGHADIGESKTAGIRDIMRYDIRRYLRKTADPFELRYMLVEGQPVAVNCHKTYQLDFVTEYRSWNDGESPHYQHTIVHLDRDGIIDVRHVRP